MHISCRRGLQPISQVLHLRRFSLNETKLQGRGTRINQWVETCYMSNRMVSVSLATLTGILTFSAFPTAWFPEVNLYPLIWLSHVPLLWVLKDKGPRASFFWGWFAGTVINVGGYYWIAHMLGTFGGFPQPLAALGSLLHGAYLGLIWAFWAVVVNRITNTTSVGIEWAAPLAMVSIELLFPRIFPAAMGNSQFPFIYVMQVCDLFGVAAVTFLIYRVNAVLFLWFRAWAEQRTAPWRATKFTGVLLVLTLGYGGFRVHQVDAAAQNATTLHIGVVEGDVGIFEVETKPRIRDHLRIQQRLSKDLEARGVDLIVWSESSVRIGGYNRNKKKFPPVKGSLDLPYAKERKKSAKVRRTPQRDFSTPLLFGTTSVGRRIEPRWEGDHLRKSYNSAFLLSDQGVLLGRYDKIELLAFGEYVPYVEHFPKFYEWVPAAGALERGTDVQPLTFPFKDGQAKIGTLICYEGILPGFVQRMMVHTPDILVNITNDDWFGKTAERYLHLALVIPRAIEQRRSVVRSTLTGVSAFIDPVGRLLSPTRMEAPEIIDWRAPLMSGTTLFQRGGYLFSSACALWLAGLLLTGFWRRRSVLR